MLINMTQLLSPIKIFGGGRYKCLRIKDLIDWKPNYVECFLGGGNVLLNSPDLTLKGEKIRKYALDVNGPLIATWRAIQNHPLELQDMLQHTEYSKENFEWSRDYVNGLSLMYSPDNYSTSYNNTIALNFLCMNRMSRGADNKTYGWSERLRRRMPEYLSAFSSMIDNLPAVSQKIQNVQFIHGCAGKDLPELSGEVCVYADPPFVHSTRTSKKAYGRYELPTYSSAEQFSHAQLLKLALESPYNWYISGYKNALYDFLIGDKILCETQMKNSASQNKKKPIMCEVLYKI